MAASLGLPGVYLEIAKRVGKLGFVGFIFIFLFLLMLIRFEPVVAFVLPFLNAKAPELAHGDLPPGLFIFMMFTNLFILVGGILKGIAIWRSRITFRQPGWAILIGSVLSFVGNFVPAIPFLTDLGFILFFIGIMGLAVAVWSEQPVTEFQSAPNQRKCLSNGYSRISPHVRIN
jgi:hypothetical protein